MELVFFQQTGGNIGEINYIFYLNSYSDLFFFKMSYCIDLRKMYHVEYSHIFCMCPIDIFAFFRFIKCVQTIYVSCVCVCACVFWGKN